MEKIVIITGGASGLGLEIAKQFLNLDYNICILTRKEEKLKKFEALREEFYKLKILTYAVNVADEPRVSKIIKDISRNFEIEYLFNNAGVIKAGHFSKNNKADIDEVFDPVIGAMILTRHVLPLMKQNNRGKIITVMSSAALLGKVSESIYCSAKFALKGFVKALRLELKSTNIKVVGIYPGGINTPFYDNIRDYTPKTVSDRYMNPKKVAKIIVENSLQIDTLNVTDVIIERV